MPGKTVLRSIIAAALTAGLMVSVQSLAAPHHAKAARAATTTFGPEVIVGASHTVSAPACSTPTSCPPAPTSDAADLTCPTGLHAIGGGFQPNGAIFTSEGSYPVSAQTWRLIVGYALAAGQSATWTPNITCG